MESTTRPINPQRADRKPSSEKGQELRVRLQEIVQRLQAAADKRVALRHNVELRWLEDLEHWHGRYDASTEADLKRSNRSQLFVNQTRQKGNAMEARLSDMLFPTDDRNWSVSPTPVPELTEEAANAAERARAARQQADESTAQQDVAIAEMAERSAAGLQSEIDEARRRAERMQEQIDDYMRECAYSAEAREVIRDACRIGTGVMKGPILDERPPKRWIKSVASDDQGRTVESWELQPSKATKPSFKRVDPWSFFPDSDARSMEESQDVYERHLMLPSTLRKLARAEGFDEDAVRQLMRTVPRDSFPQHYGELRQITRDNPSHEGNFHVVWEFRGSLVYEDALILADAFGQDLDLPDEEDPLFELPVTIWFSNGFVLSFGIHPLDSGEPIYSVFNIEKDETSVFGFSIPRIMRDSQKAHNAAWRMMMDNSGVSSGAQIVINQSAIEPEDGVWEIRPHKVWLKKASAVPSDRPFEVFHIDSHQAELANIIELSGRFIEDETGLYPQTQGDGSSTVQQTAQGMTILQNALNVIFRRIVKNFDDDLTVPVIRRAYHWAMQFEDREDIKGDYEVDARGSSVLLVREIQAQNLMIIAMQFSAHPVLGPITKVASVYRKLAQSMLLGADEIVLTDQEIEAMMAQQAEAGPDPEMMKLEAQRNIAAADNDTKLKLAQMERDTKMMEMSARMNMSLDSIQAQLGRAKMDADSKERIFAGEAAIEERQAMRGQDQKGSGGYIS